MLPKKQPWEMAQTTWATQLDPIIANPLTSSIILKNVSLAAGTNVINHRLGRNLQGWNPTRIRAAATIYDLQETNQTPQLTLVLVASAPVIIDLAVF